MFCYIYADYFGLYVPGSLQTMLAGKMGPLGPVTQIVLLGTSLMLAIHHDVELGVLYILWNHRNHTDGTCSLVRMEMAQTEGNLTGAI
jgi:hypothetical protein